MNELTLLILNFSLYIAFLLYLIKKYSIYNISVFLFFLYTISSCCSLLYYINPLYKYVYTSSGVISLEAILYLFVMNVLFCTAFRGFSLNKLDIISSYNSHLIDFLHKVVFFTLCINFIFNLPFIYNILISGNIGLLKTQVYEYGGLGHKINILLILKKLIGGFEEMLLFVPLFNILVLKKIRKFDCYSICLYFLLTFQSMCLSAGRYILVLKGIILILYLLLFKNALNKEIIKRVKFLSFLLIPFLGYFFVSISKDRFNDSLGAVSFANLRYAGEAQLNFTGLMYDNTTGITLGYRMFPFFRRLLGLEFYGSKGVNKEYSIEYLDKFNPNPNYVYYQLAGEWYLSFGKISALILAILFNVMFYLYFKKRNREIDFVKLYILILLASYIGIGIFYAEYCSDAHNLLIIYIIILSFFLRRKGKRVMLN